MKESGIDMPSFNKVKEMKFGDLNVEQMIQRVENKDGKPFFILKPSSLIMLEIAKPSTASKILRYPRNCVDKKYQEQADGLKFNALNWYWAEVDGKEFFKGDFVVYRGSQIGKIKSFCENPELDILCAVMEEYDIISCDKGPSVVRSGSVDTVKLTDLLLRDMNQYTFCKHVGQDLVVLSQEERDDLLHTERLHAKPIVNLPVNLFFDDTSANLSKKWRPLHCIQMQIAGIPVCMRQQLQTIKHLSSSIDVSTMEILRSIVDDIVHLKSHGMSAYDASLGREVHVMSDIAACVCDFNMLAEASNHMGPNTKKYCPRCYADASNFHKCAEREPEKTQRILEHLAMNNTKELRQKHGLKPYDNCLWEIINPHSDIPVGQLHWMYLGLGKFVVKKCIEAMSEHQLEKLNAMIDSCDQSPLHNRVSNDFIRYIDSRQGKDVKSYLQIAPIHMAMCGLEREKVKVICRISELSKIFSLTEKYTMESINIVDQKLANLLSGIQEVFPELTSKVKIHMSTHITEDIENHGPPHCYKEDAFEKMHGRIRGQILLQNQHAISRDTAINFAEIEILNHVLTGGFFKYQDKWLQSSDDVQSLAKHNQIQSFLGCRVEIEKKCGLQKIERDINSKPVALDMTEEQIVEFRGIFPDIDYSDCRIIACKAVTTKQNEIANENTAVLYTMCNGTEEIGIFKVGYKVLTGKGQCFEAAVVQRMEKVEDSRFNGIQCEAIALTDQNIYVPSLNVLQLISLVHACNSGFCRFKDTFVEKRVEQEMQNIRKKMWCHSTLHRIFYVNKYCLGHKKPKYMY